MSFHILFTSNFPLEIKSNVSKQYWISINKFRIQRLIFGRYILQPGSRHLTLIGISTEYYMPYWSTFFTRENLFLDFMPPPTRLDVNDSSQIMIFLSNILSIYVTRIVSNHNISMSTSISTLEPIFLFTFFTVCEVPRLGNRIEANFMK